MQRIFFFSIITLFLAACSITGSSGSQVSCSQQFWNGTISACLPAQWKVLSSAELTSLGLPEETVVAFQSLTPHAGQLDTITVTREVLTSAISTSDYSKANILAVSSLPEYKLINSESVTIDGASSTLHTFSVRPSPEGILRRYYQLSLTDGNTTGYTFTGSFPLSVSDSEAKEAIFILKNVSLKEKK